MQSEWLSEHSSEAERLAGRAGRDFFMRQFPTEAVLGSTKAAPFGCCGGLLEVFDVKVVPPPPAAIGKAIQKKPRTTKTAQKARPPKDNLTWHTFQPPERGMTRC